MTTIVIISFGYGHKDETTGELLGAPAAHLTFDLRQHFRDPHFDRALTYLTAEDQAVRDTVRTTPGIQALVDAAVAMVQAYLAGPSADDKPLRIAAGCTGGRHRAAGVALELQDALAAVGIDATITHRDLHKAVLAR